MMLSLYTLFHLNLAYSSIEEAQRPEVIRRCYWPILRLAESGVPIAVELTGFTLETIARLDPAWVERFRALLASGACELIGSGRSQLIGPLVPAAVNRANLRLGIADYERHLGVRPRLALVNEQAWSDGLVPLYREAGFEALVMEWDNPAAAHPEWPRELRYRPSQALGADGLPMPLLWSHSIAFQKFQRYAHGELELAEYLDYLRSHADDSARVLGLYTNDAEIFDFRPGRYATEAALDGGEWVRLQQLFDALMQSSGITLLLPSAALHGRQADLGQPLRLSSPAQPVPVKKQHKYNLTRWAVTGRDDLLVNTLCRRLAHALERSGAPDADWLELCDLWASDFRTHITDGRWAALLERLGAVCQRHGLDLSFEPAASVAGVRSAASAAGAGPRVERAGRLLCVETGPTRLRLDCGRGLAIDELALGGEPVIGTLRHGYFDSIALGADWFSGHLVYEAPGGPKVTDLAVVEPVWSVEGACVEVTASLRTGMGMLAKSLRVEPGALTLEYRVDFTHCFGALRLGFLTLRPEAFDRMGLGWSCHNGGAISEAFTLDGPVEHGRAVSHLVSAATCLGLTEGVIEIGDRARRIKVELDREASALVGLITFMPAGDRYLCRLAFSASELDETRRRKGELTRFTARIRLSMTADRP